MPMVKAYVNSNYNSLTFRDIMFCLRLICKEVIPAALNSPMGPLSPNCIEFLAHKDVDFGPIGSSGDIQIEVEACDFQDRAENLAERAEAIRAALHNIMPKYEYIVWLKLVKAGFAADITDKNSICDMSMDAAISRARQAINAAGLNSLPSFIPLH